MKRSKEQEEDVRMLGKRMTYRAPKGDQVGRYEELRKGAYTLGVAIIEKCPNSRERSVALTKLDEIVMWANAAIARNE